jgi:hypothetical protein
MRVTDVQPTPNPNAMKFVLDGQVAAGTLSFLTPESAAGHALASRLFALPGVVSVMLLGDFVTVNKSPQTRWSALTPAVSAVLEDRQP